MALEVRHLKLIQAVAEEGTLTRASARLNLTPSALSHQLRDIEQRLEARLFVRRKKMVLTSAGCSLLRSARTVLEELARAEEQVRRARRHAPEVLRISTECYTCYHWLPSRLLRLLEEFPQVDVQVIAEATRQPLRYLLEEKLDLAIVAEGIRNRRVRQTPLFRDELVVVLRPDHPLAARPFFRAEDFAKEHLIAYDVPKEESTLFRRILFPAGVSPRQFSRVQLTEAILEMVRAGLGIAVMAHWAVKPQLSNHSLVARRLTHAGCVRQWYAATLRVNKPSAPLNRFVELLAGYPFAPASGKPQRKSKNQNLPSPQVAGAGSAD